MKIKNFKNFSESISGWELVGPDMGPNYPKHEIPNTISSSDTEVIFGKDNKFYTQDEYENLHNEYISLGSVKPLPEFNKRNLDYIITILNNSK